MKALIKYFFIVSCTTTTISFSQPAILPGAYQLKTYLPLLIQKKVAVFANQTSVIRHTHLIDSLQKLGINIQAIFSPEHGFRGNAGAGELVSNSLDSATKIPIYSLYGKNKKPTPLQLKNIDIILFDIQDVGVRFYTYIASLQYVIEAAIEADIPMIVLDRPNPNGFYVDGPVLKPEFKSFVGMQPIPIVYGMTIGEYAKMLIGEKWLSTKYNRAIDEQVSLGEALGFETERKQFKLTVIPCKNYKHSSRYALPIAPSPNLPDAFCIDWYASTCLFEGTSVSEGRGTDHPFCVFGQPDFSDSLFAFTPIAKSFAAKPKWLNQRCYGWNVWQKQRTNKHQLDISFLLQAYSLAKDKTVFFTKSNHEYFFDKLAGSNELRQQIINNKKEIEIRNSWKKDLDAFKLIRKKYLLYKE